MINLKINNNISARETWSVPILFGDPVFENKHLYSYSVFTGNMCKEIIFQERVIAKHEYDSDNFLKKTSLYDYENNLIKSTDFSLMNSFEGGYEFVDWTPGGAIGNPGSYSERGDGRWRVCFRRSESFLGNNMLAEMVLNEFKDPIEEFHYKSQSNNKGSSNLESLFLHSYEYKHGFLREVYDFITRNGWDMPAEMKEQCRRFNCGQ
ncbi:hypothetical protein SDC9_88031 [bioreactor metagenome]|jgi:hypothetical protein|uniref:Uncharacterized protein n=1 Tax=bioreactor metagenome TaxID=1076179 RepID=A0A644ZKQ4_9ZZZZ|nr:hypothetical protein [Rikenellaceae bacterium]